jgi:hypothetical protein
MAFVYTEAKRALLAGELDLNADDMRVLLVMTNTTADTDEDATTIGGIGTLDEFDGTGYSAGVGGQTLDNEAVAADNPNDRGEFDADDETFSGLGNGTRQIAAGLLLKWITNQASSMPVAYIDTGGFPLDPNGGDLTFQWNVEGILQAT